MLFCGHTCLSVSHVVVLELRFIPNKYAQVYPQRIVIYVCYMKFIEELTKMESMRIS